MSKVIFKTLLVMLFSLSVHSRELISYSVFLDYRFDSNISQNITEENRHYFVPALGFEIPAPGKIPVYLAGEMIHDSYLRERDYDDNSPFVTLALGVRPKGKRLALKTELIGSYYMGFGYEVDNDEEVWKPVLRTAALKNRFSWSKKRKTVGLNLNGQILDYGEDIFGKKYDKSGYSIELSPYFSYKFKKDKNKTFQLRQLGIKFVYLNMDSYEDRYFYNKFTLPLSVELRLLKASIKSVVEYARKQYVEARVEDNTDREIVPHYNRLSLESEVSIPLISKLSVDAGFKLRFRNSNWYKFDHNRHTYRIRLAWNHKVERE